MTQITTIISVLIGGGILGFIQFLISRHDNKEDKEDSILSAIKDLSGRVERIENSLDERDAVLARTHILRFKDELYNGIHHPKFANGRTKAAAEYIRQEYDRLFKEHKL